MKLPFLYSSYSQDTLRSSCDNSISCTSNCCVSRYVSPLFFVSFVLFAQFVLVNILIAVLMKQLRVTRKRKKVKKNQNSGSRKKGAFNFKPIAFLQRKWEDCKKDVSFDDCKFLADNENNLLLRE